MLQNWLTKTDVLNNGPKDFFFTWNIIVYISCKVIFHVNIKRWHYLLVSFFLAKTHTLLVHLVLSHCVTQKLHNNPYSMTLHWYKVMPWLNTADLPITLNLESLEVVEHSAETTNHLSGSSPFSPQSEDNSGIVWETLRLLLLKRWCITEKWLSYVLDSVLLWYFMRIEQWEDM